VGNLDIIQIIGSNSPAIAFTIYLLYQMRNDRADALRRNCAPDGPKLGWREPLNSAYLLLIADLLLFSRAASSVTRRLYP
jgi:hypothetical protein